MNTERIKRGTHGAMPSIQVAGPFDFSDERLDTLLGEIISSGSKDLVLDLSQTSFVTGLGIACIVKMYKKIKAANGMLQIAGATDDMLTLIHLAGLDKYVQFTQ